MKGFIPLHRPDLTKRESAAISEVLASGWLTTGKRTREFEERFAERVGGRYAVALNCCTSALHLALEAIGVNASHEVIVPTLTFAATAEVISHLGARPVLVDVRPGDHNVDPDAIKRAITPRTKAIMPVHFGGQACEMDSIMAIAREHELQVIEDAAHAFPCSYQGRKIGTIGDITCFSFYATKPITTGEGGMAVTNDEHLANRMRLMSLHGISKDPWQRASTMAPWDYQILAPGFSYNMPDLAASIGLVQLDRAKEMYRKRQQVARSYIRDLSRLDTLELLDVRDFGEHAWHLFVIKPLVDILTISRDRFIEELRNRGIGASVHYNPLHCQPYYRNTFGYRSEDFPVAFEHSRRSVSLPIFSKMTHAEVGRVIDVVADVAKIFRR